MSAARTTADVAELKRCWNRWVETVVIVAERRRGWGTIDPVGYQATYRKLVEGCEAIDRSAPASRRFDHRKIADLVRPWLTTSSLAMAERELLRDLVKRSVAIDGRRRRSRPRRRLLPSIVAVGLLALGVAWLVSMREQLAFLTPYWMAIELNFYQMIAALAVMGLIWSLARTPRF